MSSYCTHWTHTYILKIIEAELLICIIKILNFIFIANLLESIQYYTYTAGI